MDVEQVREAVGSVLTILLVVGLTWFGFANAADVDSAVRIAAVGAP